MQFGGAFLLFYPCAHNMLNMHSLRVEQGSLSNRKTLEQVAGSDWKLTEEGKSAELPDEEPNFSPWDDVMGKNGRASSGAHASTSAPLGSSAGVRDSTFYR
jgi:hypothetical protein